MGKPTRFSKAPKHNLEGQRFGALTVIKYTALKKASPSSKNKRWHWLCLCDCGNYKEYDSNVLKRGNCKSCGCRIQNKGENHYKWTGYKEISGNFWCHYKHNARKRNLEFTITKEYAYELFLKQDRKCVLSGLLLKFCWSGRDRQKWKETTASLDRIDSSKGYIEGNVQWLHKDINRLKWDLNEEILKELCKLIVENNK